jgi:hypothetical protein
LEVSQVFQAFRTFSGRSDPNDPLRIIASHHRAPGTVSVGGFSPTFVLAGAATAGVVVGDRLTIRSSAIPANVGVQGTVFSVSDTQVQASMGSSVTADTDMDIEFGAFANIGRDLVVRVEAASSNGGDYLSDTLVSTDQTAVSLQRPLPVFSGPGGQPVTFEVEQGQNHPVFTSTSLLTDSELEVTWDVFSGSAVGSTPFVLLPSDPKTIELGDTLEVHLTDYATPSLVAEVVGLELSQLLIEVDPPIPSDTNVIFSNTSSVPFTRIRKGQNNNFEVMRDAIESWFSLEANRDGYAAELNRVINPLLVNTNPTISTVNTAKVYAQELSVALTQLDTILSAYSTDVVPRIDTLVDTMLSRGADRAADTLLEGNFSKFFGYNSDEVSNLGNATSQLRDVQRLDLPVRRTGRQERLDIELLLGESEEPDFEFDQSDTDTGEDVDIPGQFISIEGGSF